ncbi:MAG: hypothetical protein KGS49_10155 [Planctomycetes bacterium]|nr:hypothetical protein [Planctomycetota bacterium]
MTSAFGALRIKAAEIYRAGMKKIARSSPIHFKLTQSEPIPNDACRIVMNP